MLESDRQALHYSVISDTAHKVQRVAENLDHLYRDSYFNADLAKLKKEQLKKYIKELNDLL